MSSLCIKLSIKFKKYFMIMVNLLIWDISFYLKYLADLNYRAYFNNQKSKCLSLSKSNVSKFTIISNQMYNILCIEITFLQKVLYCSLFLIFQQYFTTKINIETIVKMKWFYNISGYHQCKLLLNRIANFYWVILSYVNQNLISLFVGC